MLVVSNIEVVYMEVILVLKGVSLDVPDGAIIALLGANGGGKSTTLKAVSGLLKPEEGEVTDGSIELNGVRIDNRDPEDIAKMGILQVMEGRRIFEHLTTEENLKAGAHIRGDGTSLKRDMDMVYNFFPKLKDLRHSTAGYLSGGEQQMLVMGRAMMADPKLMLLDEPSLGLAPLLVREIYEIVRRINQEGNTSIL